MKKEVDCLVTDKVIITSKQLEEIFIMMQPSEAGKEEARKFINKLQEKQKTNQAAYP